MRVFVGADSRGFEKKRAAIDFLVGGSHEVTDLGVYEYREGDDFNDPAVAVAQAVRENHGALGILFCDSAHGVTIQANRFRRIRAAHCDTPESARLAREHDDANILCMSAHFVSKEEMREIITTFLNTDFEILERRVRRINRLDEREDYD